jgi:2-polyprenyl-3-methyl-5-hydroxy-6-metoxy-1,4-benzoquinol methylase
MIVCPTHKEELVRNNNVYNCSKCSFEAKLLNGIWKFVDDIDESYNNFNAQILERIHEDEESNFWHIIRKKYILHLFEKYVSKEDIILEVGAGNGNVSKMLADNSYDVSVGEIHERGLLRAKNYGLTKLFQFDLFNSPFLNEFNTVGMFDVLEHFENDLEVLTKVKAMLKPGGILILTVPAHMWLWNRKDAVNDHKRRYELNLLVSKIKSAGFKIKFASNFFLFIIPFLYLRRILNRDKKYPIKDGEYATEKRVNTIFNSVLKQICKIEFLFLRNLKYNIGGSIRVVAVKPEK